MSPDMALARALVDLNANGRRTPCQVDPEPWTTDDHRVRREAAERCASCSVLVECSRAGASEEHHVWGGIDRIKGSRRDPAAAPTERGNET